LPAAPRPRRRLGAALQAALGGRADAGRALEGRAPGAGLFASDARARVFQALLDRPLTHLAGIARACRIAPPSAAWQLKVLEGRGLVQRARNGRQVRFQVTGTVDESSREVLQALRAPHAQALLAAVVDSPGLTLTQIARELRTSPQSAIRAKAPLIALGLVETLADGRIRRTYPADKLPRFLAERTASLPAAYLRVEAALRAAGESAQVTRRARGVVAFQVGQRGARREFLLRADGPLRPPARR